MKTVLLTGFEPFGEEMINPSWEVISCLQGKTHGDYRIECIQLPCVFGGSLQCLRAAIETYHPSLVIAVGQAGGRTDISMERIAINIDDARLPDNKGQQPIDQAIVANGPAAYFSTLPIKAMLIALHQAGIPASISQTAGTYVCNHVMYGLLHMLHERPLVKAGFIHIPYLPEQAAAHPNTASMSAETAKQGIEIAIHIALNVEKDKAVTGGAIH